MMSEIVEVNRLVEVHSVLDVLRVGRIRKVVPCSVWCFLLSPYSVSKVSPVASPGWYRVLELVDSGVLVGTGFQPLGWKYRYQLARWAGTEEH